MQKRFWGLRFITLRLSYIDNLLFKLNNTECRILNLYIVILQPDFFFLIQIVRNFFKLRIFLYCKGSKVQRYLQSDGVVACVAGGISRASPFVLVANLEAVNASGDAASPLANSLASKFAPRGNMAAAPPLACSRIQPATQANGVAPLDYSIDLKSVSNKI